ncbi:MAG: cell division protein FtsX, partial [Sphingomicrobium sp.]
MSRWLASPPERRLIPASGVHGPVPVLIAIMMFVMVIVAATGLALANMASVVRSGVEHRYSIQIADGAAQAPAAIAAARAAPGVARVEQVPPDALRRTLERWLGPAGTEADLPLPAIIDVDLQAGAGSAPVARAAAAVVPDARSVACSVSLSPLLDAF